MGFFDYTQIPSVCTSSTHPGIESAFVSLAYPHEGEAHVLFQHRNRPYRGTQIVELPGGTVEPDEGCATCTGIREFLEEIEWLRNMQLQDISFSDCLRTGDLRYVGHFLTYASGRTGRKNSWHLVIGLQATARLAQDIFQGFVPEEQPERCEVLGLEGFPLHSLPTNVSETHERFFFPELPGLRGSLPLRR